MSGYSQFFFFSFFYLIIMMVFSAQCTAQYTSCVCLLNTLTGNIPAERRLLILLLLDNYDGLGPLFLRQQQRRRLRSKRQLSFADLQLKNLNHFLLFNVLWQTSARKCSKKYKQKTVHFALPLIILTL